MTPIAVIGLGAMGSRMALKLLKKGHQVTVYNRSKAAVEPLREAGAVVVASPREAAQASDFVISMVRDDPASRAVWLAEDTGALCGLKPGAFAIESSTLTGSWVTELESAVQAKNAHFLAAPVVGSRPQADLGQLIYLVGGDEAAFALCQPLFMDMGSAVHHVGRPKDAALLKLAANALFGVQVAAVAELLALLRRSGMEEKNAVEVLGTLPVMSPAAKGAAALILARSFAPLFPIDLVEKDLSYVLDQGAKIQAELPTVSAAHAVFQRAKAAGFGNENINAIARLSDEK